MDQIFASFLDVQRREALALAAASDLVEVVPLDRQRFLVTFRCRGLVRENGEVREHDRFAVGISLPASYLREPPSPLILTWVEPTTIWHPNAAPPFVCIGPIKAGTPLVELIYRCFDLITFESVSMDEGNALNKPACAWARDHVERFPIDTRPLKWRRTREEASC